MFFALLFLLCGAVFFAVGVRAILRGSAAVVYACTISQPVAGLCVMAAVASLPGLFLFAQALAAGGADLAYGGTAGGALFLLLFFPGVASCTGRLECQPRSLLRDCTALVLVVLCSLLFTLPGWPVRLAGGLLLLLALGYVFWVRNGERGRAAEQSLAVAFCNALDIPGVGVRVGLFILLLGLIAVMIAAHVTVTGAGVLARSLSLPGYAAGVLLVAPPLALAQSGVLYAAVRRARIEVTAGMVVVVSFFVLTVAPGASALLHGHPASVALVVDWLCVGGGAALLVCIVFVRWQLTRPRGILLIAVYGIYLAYVIVRLNLLSILPFHI